MNVIVGSICNIGGRTCNQDYVKSSVNGNRACLVVCDGLGSYEYSDIASRICAESIINEYNRQADVDDSAYNYKSMKEWFKIAHENIVSQKKIDPEIGLSCTTATCVTTNCNQTTLAHIGDTRIYFFRNNKLSFQSVDHSLAQEAVERGKIINADIRKHKDQNKLTRVVGGEYYIVPDLHIIDTPLCVGDAFLLCTDGFWEYVTERNMEKALKSCKNPQDALSMMEKKLLKKVQANNDNYSAILAIITE